MRRLEQHELAPEVSRLSDEDETRADLALSGHGGGLSGAYLQARRLKAMAIFGWEGDKALASARRKLGLQIVRAAGGVGVGTSAGAAWEAGRFSAPYLRDDLLDAGVLVETLETAASWQSLAAVRTAVREAILAALGAGSRRRSSAATSRTSTRPGRRCTSPCWRRRRCAIRCGQWDAAKRAATDAIIADGRDAHPPSRGRRRPRALAAAEVGELGIDVLRAVKACLDPAGILNPGKLLP